MNIIFSRHAKRQMRWRVVSEEEIRIVLDDPLTISESVKGRKNFIGAARERVLKVTVALEGETAVVVTVIVRSKI